MSRRPRTKTHGVAALAAAAVCLATFSVAPARAAMISFRCDRFALVLDDAGRPVSLRDLRTNVECLNKQSPGLGFHLRVGPYGREKLAFARAEKLPGGGFRMTRPAKGGAEWRVDVAVESKPLYVTFRLTDVDVPATEDLALGFELRTVDGRTATLDLDYMMDQKRTYATNQILAVRGCLWEFDPKGRPGAFALYRHDGPEDEDEVLSTLWAEEEMPHPKTDGAWTRAAARAWVRRWIDELGVGGDASELAVETRDYGELMEIAEFAGRSGFRYVNMWAGMWRGEYWLKERRNHGLNPELFAGGEADLAAFSRALRERGMGVMMHYLSGNIGEKDPDVVGHDPWGRLASWGRGVLAGEVTPTAKTIRIRPRPGTARPRTGYGPPPNYPSYFTRSPLCLWLDGEWIYFSRIAESDTGDGTWTLSSCRRDKAAARAHAAGAPCVGVLRSHGQDFVPDMHGPLAARIAERYAGLLNRVRCADMVFDGFENHAYAGGWGRLKFASLVYEELDHPTFAKTSNGTPPACWLEYRFNSVKKLLRPNARVRMVLDHVSRPATGLDEANWAVSARMPKGLGGIDLTGHDVKGVPWADLKRHGRLARLLETLEDWKQASRLMTDADRARMKTKYRRIREHGTSAYAGGADSFYEIEKTDAAYLIHPTHVLRKTGADVLWGEVGEVGVLGPWRYAKCGERIAAQNPFAAQTPHFVIRVWPAYDSGGEGNVDLLALSRSGAAKGGGGGGGGKVEYADAVDTAGLMRASALAVKQDARWRGAALEIAAENARTTVLSLSRGDTKLKYAKPLDLTRHRGLAIEVEGDGRGAVLAVSFGKPRPRYYIVPVDFTGTRAFEIPCGEASWVHPRWGGSISGKWAGFAGLREIAVRLDMIPAKTSTRVRITKLHALAERAVPLVDPVIDWEDGRLAFRGEAPSGGYLEYTGGASATAFDADWHEVAKLPLVGQAGKVGTGEATFTIRSGRPGPAPWLQVRLKTRGEPIIVSRR